MKTPLIPILFALATGLHAAPETTADPWLWLEDITGEKAIDWVRAQNSLTTQALETSPNFKPIEDRMLAILDSKERIPSVNKRGAYYYNFWRDAGHVRGVWRRTSLAEYRKAEPAWETVLDLDALAKTENENWVWKGENFLRPECTRCLLNLSRGGGDAVVVREFDVIQKRFVDGGFTLPEAKGDLEWINRDQVYVATDFGPGSLTSSGYARVVKRWQRGTALAAATTVYEGQERDVGVGSEVFLSPGTHHEFIRRVIEGYSGEYFLVGGSGLRKVEIPLNADATLFASQLLVQLRTSWTTGGKTYPAGALIAADLKDFMDGSRVFSVLFTPMARIALTGISQTKHFLILNELDNVHSRAEVLKWEGNTWQRRTLDLPPLVTATVGGIDRFESDEYFLNVTGFLTPTTLYRGSFDQPDTACEELKQLPPFFNSAGLAVTQHEAVSPDGTRVPYFQVSRENLSLDGSHPTLLTGYGGFEQAQKPNYSAGIGAAWLERGGVFVLANIRGGGEFGPTWHEAAIKEHRQRAYDDFAAIATDLIARRVTSTNRLGIMGGSNGGLLVGVMLTQHPELFHAVVCRAPLLDMQRYNKLLAGASWMAEYGNPDKADDWSYLQKYSPYQNVQPGKHYPPVLFTTSTRDDRVHPGHARKMAAKMESQGHDVLFFENTEGGHAGSANNLQEARMSALAYTFLLKQLAGPAN